MQQLQGRISNQILGVRGSNSTIIAQEIKKNVCSLSDWQKITSFQLQQLVTKLNTNLQTDQCQNY